MNHAAFKHAACLVAIVLATALFSLPLLTHPALPFGSDLGFASQSAHGFAKALRDAVPYPRWVDSCNRGFGAPTFIFYPPLAYYATAAAAFLTRDMVGALRVVLILSTLLSGLTFYLSTRPDRSTLAAAAGAVLYVLLPYRSLDIYDRFAFAEAVAFIWFPPIFACARRLLEGRSRAAWFGLVTCYAGLVFTHLVTAFMVLFVLAPYTALHAALRRNGRRLPVLLGALATALACSAVYLVPMAAQRGGVHMDWVVQAFYGDWRRNFVFRDEVAFGFAAAPIKPYVAATATSQGVVAIAAAIILGWRGWRERQWRVGSVTAAPRAILDSHAVEGLAQVVLSAWTFFLQVPISTPIWAAVPELGTVQFPWRFGLFQGLAACFLLTTALGPSGSEPSRPGRAAWAALRRPALALALLILAALPALTATRRITANREYIFDEAMALRPEYLTRVMTEYIPRGVEGWLDFERVPYQEQARAFLDAPGRLEVVAWTTHSRRLRLQTAGANTLRLRTFAYPGWKAWLDGSPVEIGSANVMHAIQIAVPPGPHELVLRFLPTADRRIGAALSLLSVATLLAVGVLGRIRSQSAGA